MKITWNITDNNILQSTQAGQSSKITAVLNKSKDSKEVKNAAAGNDVNLSTRAVEFNKIKNAINDVPDIREDILSAIGDQLRYGKYEVSPELIASKLLNEYIIDELLME